MVIINTISTLIILVLTTLFSWEFITIKIEKKLNSESFRDSTKLGIIITTLAYPILISSNDWFDKPTFWSIIFYISLSTFLGLWNNFSIATLANEDGKITINKCNNNLMPSILVLQFLSMLVGIAFAVISFAKPIETKKETHSIEIIQSSFPIGKSRLELLKSCGVPTEVNKTKDTTTLKYTKSGQEVIYKIYNDTIIESYERRISTEKKN